MFNINETPVQVRVTKRMRKFIAKVCPGEILKAEKWNDFVYIHVKNKAGELALVSIPFVGN